ncbi:CoA transferase [Sphingomonas sp. YL-JM2C]
MSNSSHDAVSLRSSGQPLPLAGLRVLDFSRVLAGPLCTQMLGDLGADVIKIETPGAGDETRGWPPFEGEGFGTVFLAVNRNKRSMAIDLKTAEGRGIVHRIASGADIAIENFSTGVAERLGIDYATLSALNDRLIYCTLSGYGRDGPMRNDAGYDVILQAFSGIMSLTGEPDGGHVRIPISPVDQVTGINALVAMLAALYRRTLTGKGGLVEVSLLETAVSLLNHPLQSFWARGVQPPKFGSSHESLCPYEVFEASDGSVMIGIANNNLWRKFCPLAGLDHLTDDPRFATNAERAARRPEVLAIVREVVAKRTVADWVTSLSAASIPVAPINDLAAMLAEPQVQARNIVLDYEGPMAKPLKAVAAPFTIDGMPRRIDRRPPALGEHTDELLMDLGFGSDEIDALKSKRIVASAA